MRSLGHGMTLPMAWVTCDIAAGSPHECMTRGGGGGRDPRCASRYRLVFDSYYVARTLLTVQSFKQFTVYVGGRGLNSPI